MEEVPEDDYGRIPVMAPTPSKTGEEVLIKVEHTELVRSPDGTLSVKISPTMGSHNRLSPEAMSGSRELFPRSEKIRPGKRAAPAKAGGRGAKKLFSASKRTAARPAAQATSSSSAGRARRAAAHGSGFYNEENQRALKRCKGGGTTKNPYVIE